MDQRPDFSSKIFKYSFYIFRLPTLPYIPGGDAGGVIEAVGSEVSDLKIGRRVYVCGPNSGSYAEYVTSDASMTFPLPEGMTFSQGAAIGVPYFTAYRALVFVAKLKKGENLLVHGVSEQKKIYEGHFEW